MRFKHVFLRWALWGLSLAAVSWSSGYNIRGSVGRVSLEIATMLTPVGMIRIFAAENHWLKPYYMQKVSQDGFWQSPALTVLFTLFGLISFSGLLILRRGLRGSR